MLPSKSEKKNNIANGFHEITKNEIIIIECPFVNNKHFEGNETKQRKQIDLQKKCGEKMEIAPLIGEF